MRRIFLIVLLVAACSVNADVYMKQKQHTDGFEMMGQKVPAEDATQSIWITPSKIKSDSEKSSFIMDTDKKLMIVINHLQKTYMEMPLDFGAQMMGENEQQNAEIQDMMKNMAKLDVKVTETGEKQKIGSWNCQKYLQQLTTAMGPIEIEVWATQDIGVDVNSYAKLQSAALAMMPGMAEALKSAMKEMEKVKGIAVKTTSTSHIMGSTVKSETELLECKEGKAPAEVFKIPQGYAKKSMADQY
ncbi:DUF4412 domain-containing protein [candidate division KSB1 bacterium]|nr:DUF4412 domain-containing protein [candidate division KSB1 bacterium]